MTEPAPSRETLNLRVRPDDRALFDRAARVTGQNRSQFVLGAARAAATNALLDQALISLDPDVFSRFAAALDAPAQPNDRLKRTLAAARPWEGE